MYVCMYVCMYVYIYRSYLSAASRPSHSAALATTGMLFFILHRRSWTTGRKLQRAHVHGGPHVDGSFCPGRSTNINTRGGGNKDPRGDLLPLTTREMCSFIHRSIATGTYRSKNTHQ